MDAYTATRQLNGKWYREYGTAACPICQPEGRRDQSALTLRDGRNCLLLHCKKAGCAFSEIIRAIEDVGPAPIYVSPPPAPMRTEYAGRVALDIWLAASPISGTIAEKYLRSRGLPLPPTGHLRFVANCRHPTGVYAPAMVARVKGADGFGIHRTYLAPDGSGKASLSPARAMLGAASGGAVRLLEGRGALVVSEGIENALSYFSMKRRGPRANPADQHIAQPLAELDEAAVWAALSTSGLRNLRLPQPAGKLIIAADCDVAGIAAAHGLARRVRAAGWEVGIAIPASPDWNEQLLKNEAEHA